MQMQEWAALLTALGIGGGITEAFRSVGSRRARKADALEKLEGIATRLADRATEAADKRVAQVEAQLTAYEARDREREERRRTAAALHTQWDNALADQVRALGGSVAPPPPLEVA